MEDQTQVVYLISDGCDDNYDTARDILDSQRPKERPASFSEEPSVHEHQSWGIYFRLCKCHRFLHVFLGGTLID